MGVQQIGGKKTRQAAMMTGLPIFRALRHSNRLWYGFVKSGIGHWHIRLDPITWAWQLSDGSFSSCHNGEWGPHVDPPRHLRELAEARWRAGLMEAKALRLTNALAYYADPRCYEVQENWAAIHSGSLETYVPIEDDKGAIARITLEGEEE